ncbi:MAG: Lrp/AsnC family transcriptional regulator [Candidatus Micrarchaeota archaeon]
MKLDTKDMGILHELSKNCRSPVAKIGKKLSLPREVVDYRIKRLVKAGVIKDFIAEIDLDRLGFTKSVVYLELKGLTKERENEIINKLVAHPFTSWVVSSTGKWSVIFDVHSKSTGQLAEIVEQIKDLTGKNLGECRVVTLRDYKYFHSKFFGEELPERDEGAKIELDKKDKTILRALSKNGRKDFVTIAKEMGLTPEAVSMRTKRLIKNGAIKRFHIFVDLRKLAYEQYNIQVNFENIDKKTEQAILKFLSSHPNVSFYYRPVGHWDVEFGVFVRNPGELREFVRLLRSNFPENIRIYDTSLFYEELKGNYAPEALFV